MQLDDPKGPSKLAVDVIAVLGATVCVVAFVAVLDSGIHLLGIVEVAVLGAVAILGVMAFIASIGFLAGEW